MILGWQYSTRKSNIKHSRDELLSYRPHFRTQITHLLFIPKANNPLHLSLWAISISLWAIRYKGSSISACCGLVWHAPDNPFTLSSHCFETRAKQGGLKILPTVPLHRKSILGHMHACLSRQYGMQSELSFAGGTFKPPCKTTYRYLGPFCNVIHTLKVTAYHTL